MLPGEAGRASLANESTAGCFEHGACGMTVCEVLLRILGQADQMQLKVDRACERAVDALNTCRKQHKQASDVRDWHSVRASSQIVDNPAGRVSAP